MARISIRRITITYIVALSFLAVLVIAAYFILVAIVIEQGSSSSVINTSGRQRMLSQRIAMFSLRLVIVKDVAQRQHLRKQLRQSANLMEQSHEALIFGNEELGIPEPPEQVRNIYFKRPTLLNEQVQDYLAQARALVREDPAELTLQNPHLNFILTVAESRLLRSLDKAVSTRQEISENLIDNLRTVLILIIIVILVVIIMETMLVFYPLTRRIRAESEALSRSYEQERRIASTLQRSLVPTEIPKIEGIEISTYYQSATWEAEVGGDFYDFFKIAGTQKWAIVVGDVAGKGIDAAAETARVKYLVRDRAQSGFSADKILESVNRALILQQPTRFTALTLIIYDRASSALEIVNSGNPYPYFAAKDEFIQISGTPLSILIDEKYPVADIKLNEGDLLLTYTDGLVEVRQEGELFGEERVRGFIKKNQDLSLEAHLEGLVEEARKFSGDNLTDDVLILGIKKTG